MYIFAVALEDGRWHHVESYLPERAKRPGTVALWQKICTVEDAEWDRKYHDPDPNRRAFGGRVVVTLRDDSTLEDEIEVADAHMRGAKPFGREDYLRKFGELAGLYASPVEQERFLSTALSLPTLVPGRLTDLTVEIPEAMLDVPGLKPGLFERHGH
jgi:2-methylcitrate dehydratase